MTINITSLESALQTKINAATGTTESKEFLLLTKALESLNAGAVSTVATTGDLPTASTNTGRLIFVTGDSTLYTSNGTAWVAVATGTHATDFVSATSGGTFSGDVTVAATLKATSYTETFVTVTSSAGVATIDCSAGNSFSITLTENTTITPINVPVTSDGYPMGIKIIQDAAASGFVVTWPTNTRWPGGAAPTLTATASAIDSVVLSTETGGTNWDGYTAGLALAVPA